MKNAEQRDVFLVAILSVVSIVLILLGISFIINPLQETMGMPINQGAKQLKN